MSRDVSLRHLGLRITNLEPERNAALTFRLYYRIRELDPPDTTLEGICAPPRWKVEHDDYNLLSQTVNVEHEATVEGDVLFECTLFPADESVPFRLGIQDQRSRKRVRMPSQLGTYDRNNWEHVRTGGGLAAMWRRQLEKENR